MSILDSKQLGYRFTGSFTGSLIGTASYAMNGGGGGTGAGFPFVGSAVITGSLLVSGSSGSLLISGSGVSITGSLNAPNITGSLLGTASYALNGGLLYATGTTLYTTFSIVPGGPTAADSLILGSDSGGTNLNKTSVIGIGNDNTDFHARSTIIGTLSSGNKSSSFSNIIGTINQNNTRIDNSSLIGTGIQNNSQVKNSLILGNIADNSQISESVYIGNKIGFQKNQTNNILIGNGIGLPNSSSNAINIGGLIFGTGSIQYNGVDVISGSANGKIGINQPYPSYSLHVAGTMGISGLTTGYNTTSNDFVVVDPNTKELKQVQYNNVTVQNSNNANYATSASYAVTASYIAPVEQKYVTKLTQTASVSLTTGSLIVGETYLIKTHSGADNFTNVGAPNNNEGTSFVATNTTPINWTNASELVGSGNPFGPISINQFDFTPQWKRMPKDPDAYVDGQYFFNTRISYNPDKTAPIVMPNSSNNTLSTIEANPQLGYYIDDLWTTSSFGSDVRCLAAYNTGSISNHVLVGGRFDTINGKYYGYLVRLDETGSIDNTFISSSRGFDDFVYSLLINEYDTQNNYNIYVGGSFLNYTDPPNSTRAAYSIARLRANGDFDDKWGPQLKQDNSAATVYTMASSGITSTIYIGGVFNNIKDEPIGINITKLDLSDGGKNIDWVYRAGYGFNGAVNTIAVRTFNNEENIYVGGSFGEYSTGENGNNNTYNARGIICLDQFGRYNTSFNYGEGFDKAGGSPTVYSIVVQPDGKLLVGGLFDHYSGSAANNIVRINPDGTIDPTFNTDTNSGFNGEVYSITLQSDYGILVGGNFTEYKHVPVYRIARLNDIGSLINTFSSGSNGKVYTTLSLPYGKCIAGGGFTSISYNNGTNNVTRDYLAKLYASYDVVLTTKNNSESTADNQILNTLVEVTQYT